MNAAIAQHLNILESAIVKVEEWANVVFVVAKGIGARFVSKKITERKKMLNPSATKITYEAIKDNKRADSNSPKQQWIAHSQFEIDLFNQLPKTVQWQDESGNKCIARFNKDKEQYTIGANGRQRQVHYKALLNAMPTMPSNAVITPFEAKDIVWV